MILKMGNIVFVVFKIYFKTMKIKLALSKINLKNYKY